MTTTRATGFSPLHEQWLERFARLTSAALASAQSQESLRFRVRLEVALRRVASASADGTLDAQRLAELVASEAAELLDASFAAIVRFERADETSVLGHFGEFPFPHSLASEGRATVTGQVARTGQPARIDDYSTIDGSPAAAHGVAGAVGVPLRIGGALWGCMVAMTRRVGGFAPDAEAVLERFAELVCAALANARAHDRLRAQAAVLSSLQDGLVVLDKSGRIIKVNDALCRMTGYGSEELIGASAPYPFSAGAAEDEVAVTEPANPVERTLRRKDGSVLHVAASVANFADSDHTVSGRAAVFTDISHTVFHSHLEQALSEVAAASADGEYEARTLFDLVSDRVANLFDAAAAAVVRFDDQRGTVVGQHGDGELPDAQLDQPGAASRVAGTGEAARIDDYERTSGAFASQMVGAGLRCAVAVPVRVRGALWGCLVVASDRPRGLAADTEQLLERFAALVSVALASADTRATLQRQASTDGLTGLLNHRAFQHSLHEERRRAVRHHRPLALAMFDLDGFKEVNDTHGHQAGDRVLRTVARTFVESKRAGDIAARIGGDEFAVIAPDTDAQDALALAERLRQAAAAALAELQLPVTLSAGVTDLGAASTMHDLFHLADSALYWAKHHGRNQAVRYAPGAGHDVSDELRQRRFERGRTLTGLSALARAVDAKDALTQQHAERVADIAARLAARRGWNPDRCARLREAALLHDVGKIGVPDAILGKPGKLTADEYEQVKGHTLLGARIAGEVLDEEQVRWVRWHHERPDGRGYPDALPRERIPEGALLLGVADAFDAMTDGRPYQAALSPSTVLAEMRSHAGTQFDQDLLDLLEQWALGAGPDVANAA